MRSDTPTDRNNESVFFCHGHASMVPKEPPLANRLHDWPWQMNKKIGIFIAPAKPTIDSPESFSANLLGSPYQGRGNKHLPTHTPLHSIVTFCNRLLNQEIPLVYRPFIPIFMRVKRSTLTKETSAYFCFSRRTYQATPN